MEKKYWVEKHDHAMTKSSANPTRNVPCCSEWWKRTKPWYAYVDSQWGMKCAGRAT